METRSHESVTVILEGRDLGCGTLTVGQEELIWTASSADLFFKLHYTSIRKYGIFPSCPVDNWRERLTVIGNLDGQAGERTVVLLLDDALSTVLDMLIDRVDLDPTIEASLKPHVTKISTSTLSTVTLRTHVTCLEFIGELLFAGIGDTLHVFSRKESEWTLLMSHQIFRGQNIYGIKGNGKHLVTYGGKNVCLLRYKFAFGVSQVKLIHNFTVEGWVLDCIWLNGGPSIALLTANNVVVSYNIGACDIVKSSTIYCSERCILYSGKLLGTNWADIIVLAGTVFSTIMIWKNNEDSNVNVIHELEGHKGVIFSVTFCEKTHRICSTSDDRTVRVWDVEFKNSCSLDWTNCSITLKFSLYGHSARVWKSNFLGSGKVVSVGEDSQICLWNNDGTLDNQWSGHQGGEIWSLAVSGTLQLIATGGSDSGISLWPVASAPLPRVLTLGSSTMEITPRCVGLTQNGSPFMVNSNGDILLHTNGSWNCVMSDSRFSSYCLHSINPTRTMVAFGSITGFVLICRFELNSISKLLETAVCDGRIFSVIWLSDDTLATCATGGVFSIWNVPHPFQTLERMSTFVLPHSKERWITSCAANEQYVVCGDRLGSLFLYSKLGNENPIFCAKRIHGHNGVTDVKLIDEHVFSTGRDGKYREFVIEKGELVLLRCCKLKLDWAAAIAETELLNKLLLCFHGVFFVIWSVHERRAILKIDCGGGHRSWDCLVDSVNGNINLTYIKGKSVFYFCVPVRDVISHSVVPGGHPKSINAAAIVPILYKCSDNSHSDGQLVILGGEDTTLRLVSFGTKSEILLSVLQSHLSSIRSVVCQQSNFHDTVYVVSGGGRGQLVVWRILHSVTRSMLEMIELTSHCVIETPNKNQKVTHDSAEMRIMDLELYQNSSEMLTICAACSDGLLRMFNYDIHNNTVSHLQDVIRGHCLLKVLHVDWGFPFIVSACTSGLLVFHNILEGKIVHGEMVNSYSASDSGINSCDYILTEDYFVLSCAGDDAHVNIIAFTRNNQKFNVKSHWKNTTAHTCQVSGLKMAENWLFSAGLDRTLAVFTWKLSGAELVASLVDRLNLCIPDVHGTLVWRRDGDDKMTVFVHGLGTQLLTFSCHG